MPFLKTLAMAAVVSAATILSANSMAAEKIIIIVGDQTKKML